MNLDKADWRSRLEALKETMPTTDAALERAEEPAPEQPAPSAAGAQKGRLQVVFERKGRGGKQATIVCGFTCGDEQLQDTARLLKQRLGVGGSARGGEILIQGDKRREVVEALRALGFKV